MKKIKSIFNVLILMAPFALAGINGVYYLNNPVNNINCCITIFEDKYFYIELDDRISDDIYQTDILSYGTFSLNKNELSLADAVNGYKIQLKVLNENQIKVNKGFSFLENKLLIYQRSESMSTEHYKKFYFEKTETDFSLQKEINKYNLDDKCYILYDGLYLFAKYKLKIEKDSSYVFSYEDIVISEGTWTRQSNILSLYDLSLQHSFYVFIEEKGLNCKFLPGIYRNDLFILEQ